MNDYLDQKNNLHSLYNRFPTIENFDKSLKNKLITMIRIESL
jgi:hypothetical protein